MEIYEFIAGVLQATKRDAPEAHDDAQGLQRARGPSRGPSVNCPVCEERRNSGQNAAQWPILGAWAKQKQWPINGAMCWLTDEEWKDVLTAAFEGETRPRIAPSLDGTGMVMLGRRTSNYGKKKFSLWLDWLNAASHHAGIKVPAHA